MANLLCDEMNCSQLAFAFGLQGATKTKVCSEHALNLSNQGLPLLDISAHSFVETEQDVHMLQEKQKLMQKGMERLAIMESRCEEDWRTAVDKLQNARSTAVMLVERSFKEIELQVEQRYTEILRLLATHRHSFQQLLQSKDSQLPPDASSLCEVHPSASLFSLVLADCSVPIVELILQNCHLLDGEVSLFPDSERLETFVKQADDLVTRGEMDIASQAWDYIEALSGRRNPVSASQVRRHRVKATKRLMTLLPSTLPLSEVKELSGHYLETGRAARREGNYARALHKLQKGENLLKQWNLGNADMKLELGLTLSHFGKLEDADLIIREGLQLEPSPALSLALVECYFQAGELQATAQVCEWTLTTWENTASSEELLSALYYLQLALLRLRQVDQCDASVRRWIQRLPVDTPSSQSLLLAITAKLEERLEAKTRGIETAVELGLSCMPDSYISACSLIYLGLCYQDMDRDEEAKVKFTAALRILSKHYPLSAEFCKCHMVLGDISESASAFTQSEAHYTAALAVYTFRFTNSREHAAALYSLGHLYSETKPQEAETLLLQGSAICEEFHPNELILAFCQRELGEIYLNTERKSEAVQKFKAALPLYERYHDFAGAELCKLAVQLLNSN